MTAPLPVGLVGAGWIGSLRGEIAVAASESALSHAPVAKNGVLQ